MNAQETNKIAFKQRVSHWADKLDVSATSIVVRSMKTKWASCSTAGRLTFDAVLVDLPVDLQDYVIVHELLHFHVPNHGRLWQSLMRVHLGDFEQLDSRLNKYGYDRND
jgi:predicted metal-dependent hydrolase